MEGVSGDGSARILHTGTRSKGLGRRKRDGEAYVMPNWAGEWLVANEFIHPKRSFLRFNLAVSDRQGTY